MPVVKFYASLRRITGRKEENVPGSDLGALLQALVQVHPDLAAVLWDGRRVKGVIMLNGQTLDPAQLLGTPLSETDQVSIFPPISGG